jgi:hypothetical protein
MKTAMRILTMQTTRRLRVKRHWSLWTAAAVVLICTHCSRGNRIQFEVYPEVQLRQEQIFRTEACQDTIEVLLTELWDSDFFQWQNPLLLEEVLDNNYGIFECDARTDETARFRAFYKKEEEREQIMLNKRLFRHFESTPNWGFRLRDMDRRIKSTLVHELLHDFWFNVLDDRLKAGFTDEADLFFNEVSKTKTRSDKMSFLRDAGYLSPSPSDFTPFAELQGQKNRYGKKELYGTELYSILADRAFSGHILIPRRFREYYRGILSEKALNRGRR